MGLWWTGVGKFPTKCPEHLKNAPRYKLKRGQKLKRVPRQTFDERKAAGAPIEAMQEMRAALWSQLVEPERAIEYALEGKEVPSGDLPALIEAMMAERNAELREGRPSATARLLSVGVGLMSVGLLEAAASGTIKPAQLPMSIRLSQQALEAFGGGKLAFSSVSVDFGGLEEEEDDE